MIAPFALAALLVAPTPLERIVVFDAPRDCGLAPPLAALIAGLARFDEERGALNPGEPVELEGLGRAAPAIAEAGEGWVRIVLPLRGSWHGLTLLALEQESGIESGPNNILLVFAERPQEALAKLNALGFDLPAAEGGRELPGEVIDGAIALERRGEGSALVCSSD